MALTAEQKQERRLATNARNRAYHARYRERLEAEERGKEEIKRKLGPEIEQARAVEENIQASHDESMKWVDRKIAELEVYRKSLEADFRQRWSEVRAVSAEVHQRERAAEDELEAQLGEGFSRPGRPGPMERCRVAAIA